LIGVQDQKDQNIKRVWERSTAKKFEEKRSVSYLYWKQEWSYNPKRIAIFVSFY